MKKVFYTLLLISILIVSSLVYSTSYTPNLIPDPGHDGDHIWVKIGTSEKTLQTAINDKLGIVGTLTNTKWCRSDGSKIICDKTQPVLTETDPSITQPNIKDGVDWSEISGIPTSISDGDQIGILSETDPQVGSVNNDQWCKGNSAGQVQCTTTSIPYSSLTGTPTIPSGGITGITTASNSGLLGGVTSGTATLSVDTLQIQKRVVGYCANNNQFIKQIYGTGGVECATPTSTESDPQVGTVTSGKMCTGGSGGIITCGTTIPTDTNTNADTICTQGAGYFLDGVGTCYPYTTIVEAGFGADGCHDIYIDQGSVGSDSGRWNVCPTGEYMNGVFYVTAADAKYSRVMGIRCCKP